MTATDIPSPALQRPTPAIQDNRTRAAESNPRSHNRSFDSLLHDARKAPGKTDNPANSQISAPAPDHSQSTTADSAAQSGDEPGTGDAGQPAQSRKRRVELAGSPAIAPETLAAAAGQISVPAGDDIPRDPGVGARAETTALPTAALSAKLSNAVQIADPGAASQSAQSLKGAESIVPETAAIVQSTSKLEVQSGLLPVPAIPAKQAVGANTDLQTAIQPAGRTSASMTAPASGTDFSQAATPDVSNSASIDSASLSISIGAQANSNGVSDGTAAYSRRRPGEIPALDAAKSEAHRAAQSPRVNPRTEREAAPSDVLSPSIEANNGVEPAAPTPKSRAAENSAPANSADRARTGATAQSDAAPATIPVFGQETAQNDPLPAVPPVQPDNSSDSAAESHGLIAIQLQGLAPLGSNRPTPSGKSLPAGGDKGASSPSSLPGVKAELVPTPAGLAQAPDNGEGGRNESHEDAREGSGQGREVATATPGFEPALHSLGADRAPASATPPVFPASTGIDRAHLAQQLSRHIESMRLSSGNGEMTLRLSPEHLGGLHLSIASSANGVAARIVVETTQAQQAVEGARDQLRTALENRGLSLASLDVSLNQGGAGNNAFAERRQFEEVRALRPPRAESGGLSPLAPAVVVPTAVQGSRSRARLDYHA